MSMALAGDVIAAGQDASCHILRFRLQGPDKKSSSSAPSKAGGAEKGPRKRKAPSPSEKGEGDTSEAGEVAVETLCSVQTDFSPDALQKAVRVSADHSLLATGGADGFLRVWEVGAALREVMSAGVPAQDPSGLPLGGRGPVSARQGPRWPSSRAGGVRVRVCAVYLSEQLSGDICPTSDSGTFLGLGTVTGSVAIHVSFSLQRLYYVKEAHGIVVTDVAFLPESRRGRELLAENEAALLSVAVDSRCKLHLLPPRRTFPVWLLLLLCTGLVVATILLLQLAFPGFL
ncbi:guanine nucleotide-exchange factor SEC12 [Chelonoidis abingdonii]|uniref:guanine nucleotide-exchange factor SEC12 n=1 Tax=Chelonoidis abingdonii TaxID=106734 RepID=UPI0013F18A18|nr:prolactin regulatory element-binding protein-like [Chelonoidis abingdonii]